MLTKFLAFIVVVLTVILSILWLTNIFPATAKLVFQTEVVSATLRDLLLFLWSMVIVSFLLGWVLSSFSSWFSSFWRIFAFSTPTKALDRLNQGILHFLCGNFSEAYTLFNKATSVASPLQSSARCLASLTAIRTGRSDKACEHIHATFSDHNAVHAAAFVEAEIIVQTRSPEEACDYLVALCIKHPTNERIACLLKGILKSHNTSLRFCKQIVELEDIPSFLIPIRVRAWRQVLGSESLPWSCKKMNHLWRSASGDERAPLYEDYVRKLMESECVGIAVGTIQELMKSGSECLEDALLGYVDGACQDKGKRFENVQHWLTIDASSMPLKLAAGHCAFDLGLERKAKQYYANVLYDNDLSYKAWKSIYGRFKGGMPTLPAFLEELS